MEEIFRQKFFRKWSVGVRLKNFLGIGHFKSQVAKAATVYYVYLKLWS